MEIESCSFPWVVAIGLIQDCATDKSIATKCAATANRILNKKKPSKADIETFHNLLGFIGGDEKTFNDFAESLKVVSEMAGTPLAADCILSLRPRLANVKIAKGMHLTYDFPNIRIALNYEPIAESSRQSKQ